MTVHALMKRALNTVLAVLFCVLAGSGAECCRDSVQPKPLRPVISSFMAGVGRSAVLDTYLSPVRYDGIDLRLGYERIQAMKFSPERWVMQINAGIDYTPAKNPARSRTIHTLMVDAGWGMMHRWRDLLAPRLQFYAGGFTSVRGGALYAPDNSNNVVSVKAAWNIGFSGMVAYNLKLWRLPVTLRYQASLPLLGVMYSLDYGDNYFEMYEGNTSGLVHLGWIGNCFTMTNLVTADMHLGNTTLRVGYRGVAETSWVNNLNTQIFRHSFVLGVGGEWISLKPGKPLSDKARVISAMY